jgi:hypothetical protein
MFLMVALFSVWLGREAWIVRERSTMRRWLEENDGSASPTMQLVHDTEPFVFEPFNTLPFWRRWLGDQSIATVNFSVYPSPSEDIERAKRLFPEAKIMFKLVRLPRHIRPAPPSEDNPP